MKIDDVKIGERFRKDPGDIEGLSANIQKLGLLHPIVVHPDGTLIAGLRRLKAYKLLGWDEIPTTRVDIEDVARGQVDENLQRKGFTLSEMVAVAKAMEPAVREAARERHDAQARVNLGITDGGKLPPSGGKTRDKVAAYIGCSGKTLEKAARVVEAAEQDPGKFGPFVELMDKTGKVDLSYRKLKQASAGEPPVAPELPAGEYDVIMANPPWIERGPNTISGEVQDPCPAMTAAELKAFRLPYAQGSTLFLWAPPPKLVDALAVMKAWGFTYKTSLIWVKELEPGGKLVTERHETLLVGTKGNPTPPAVEDVPGSVIKAPENPGNMKPSRVYDIVEEMFPEGRYLELLSQSGRKKWTTWPESSKPEEQNSGMGDNDV